MLDGCSPSIEFKGRKIEVGLVIFLRTRPRPSGINWMVTRRGDRFWGPLIIV